MATVTVSAARIASMLRNRNLSPDALAERLRRPVDVRGLVVDDRELEFEDLEALGAAFGKQWPYLLIDEPEAPPRTGRDHRTVANQRRGITPELYAEIDAADRMLDEAIDLLPGVTVTIPTLRLGARVDPDTAGASVRAGLEVAIEDQLAAKDHFAALRLWVAALHRQGIFVSQRRLRDPTIRAFSLSRQDRAVVVVDTGDTPYARIFSLVHEYVHVAMRATGVCDLNEHSTTERYCNGVAAAALLPAQLIRAEGAWSWGEDDDADDRNLQQLSRHFRVSQAATLIRLRDLGVLNQELYEELESRRQSRRLSSTPGGTYYPTEINKVGRLFAHGVFDAYDAGIVNRQDIAALLGVGEHNVARYRSELDGDQANR